MAGEEVRMEMVDRYESPGTLALVANAPEIVCRMVFAIAGDRQGLEHLRGASHLPELCRRRHAIAWAARKYAGATFSQIGRALNRDGNGSTMARSFNQAKLLRRKDPEFKRLCDDLRNVLHPREIVRLKARTGNGRAD
jgi:hypothetical protein